MTRYGLYSPTLRDFLTFQGRVLVHSSELGAARAKAELEFLFPASVVREVPASIPADQCLPVAHHPRVRGAVTFPLDRREFVHG